MPLDSICISALALELNARLCGAVIDKIHEPSSDTVVMTLRTHDGTERLLLCGGGCVRVHITRSRFENPDAPPMFCMLLRKHLTGARITDVSQSGRERLVDITLDAPDALGDRHEKHLIIELISSAPNIILTDAEGLITDCLRRSSGDMSGKRRLLPGLYYRLPEKQDKHNPFALSLGEKLALLESASGDPALDRLLLDTFEGLSPLICREIAYRFAGYASPRLSEVRRSLSRAAEELQKITDSTENGEFTPCLLSDSEKPRDFSFTDITQYGDALTKTTAESFSDLLDAFYAKRSAADAMRSKSQSLLKTVKNAKSRLERKISAQKTEILAASDREELRRAGDLIMANIAFIPRGASEYEAEDFYAEDGAKRRIKLNPAKSPQQNAAKYYKDFNRAKNAEKILAGQIETGEREIQYLESVIAEAETVQSEKDLAELRQELEDAGYLRKQKTGRKMKRPVRKPMRFVSDGGFEILVGRTGTQNDALTKNAQRTDIWLHTQKIHGSHAVISCCGERPDEGTLLQAARLAALYSQARTGQNVPVDYTLVKHVKKPSGARPGMVIYTEQKTLCVTPDEKEAARLQRE